MPDELSDASTAAALAATTASTAAALAASTAQAAVAMERRFLGIENQLAAAAKIADLKDENAAMLSKTRHETVIELLDAIDEKSKIANGRTTKNEERIDKFATWQIKVQTYFGLLVFLGPIAGGCVAGVLVWGLNRVWG